MGGTNKCPVCSATFTRSQHVARHMRSHTGDRPYPCPWCPEKFARSDLLARHKKKFHPDGPNSAPPPPKYSRQPKPSTSTAPAGPPLTSGAAAVAGKGKGRAADSTADDVARLSLADPARRGSLGSGGGMMVDAYGNPLVPGSSSLAPPLNRFAFDSLPGFDGAGLMANPSHPPTFLGQQQQQQQGYLPHSQQQQLEPPLPPQPAYHNYDRRFSLPGGLPGAPYGGQPLHQAYGGGHPSSRGSSASSSEYDVSLQPTTSRPPPSQLTVPSAYAPASTTGLVDGLSDSPVGVSPADSSASTFASSSPALALGGGRSSSVSQQQWYSTPFSSSYQQPIGGGQAPPRQNPYYGALPAATASSSALLPPGRPASAYDFDQAAYVPHLLAAAPAAAVPTDGGGSGTVAGADGAPRSPLALGGWSGLDWSAQPFNPDSRPSTSFVSTGTASPGLFGTKPSLNPLQNPSYPPGGGQQAQQSGGTQKIPSLEDVKDIWRYFLSPALPTPAAQPFGGIAPIAPGLPAEPQPDSLSALDIPGGNSQQQQQQPFATDEAQARSFEDAIRSRPTMQLQPPGSSRPARTTMGYNGGGLPQQQQQQPPSQQPQQPSYHSTWPPVSIPPSESRGLLSSSAAGKREYASIDLETPRGGAYGAPAQGGGGRPKMARMRSGSVGRVPEGQVWEGFLEGYRGAAQGLGGGEGGLPSA